MRLKRLNIFQLVGVHLGMVVFISIVWAGPVTDQVRETIDKALTVLSDTSLKAPDMGGKRRQVLREIGNALFDWEEMAKRSLGIHWQGRTAEEKREFVQVFTDLLERTYMDKIESYAGEKILYGKEAIDGSYASLETNVNTKNGEQIPVNYQLIDNQGRWLVYDVSIEGVSLIRNYRVQFNDFLSHSSFHDLIVRLKNKQEPAQGKSSS